MTATHTQFRHLAVIGVGLIGGSVARSLRQRGLVAAVTGCGRQPENLARALDLGIVDAVCHDPAEAVAGADVVLVATPVKAMESVFERIAPQLSDDAVITDAGSVKAEVVTVARRGLGDRFSRFVPAHPIAGTEQSGAEASFAELFHDRYTVLTPTPDTDTGALETVRELWLATGCRLIDMDADEHDRILGASSHLPHLLAYALVDYLAGLPDSDRHFQLAAGGFRDFTRIASSDPVMWRDVCLSNRPALVTVLDGYIARLMAIRESVDGADSALLEQIFSDAKIARDQYLKRTF